MSQCIERALQNLCIEQALQKKENEELRAIQKLCIEKALREKQERSNACDLACTKKRKQTPYLEYVGPLHIAIVEPPAHQYRNTMCETSSIIMAYFTMGAAVMPMLWYTMSFDLPWPLNLHIMLFTIAYQLLIPAGFLMMNSHDGAGLWMKERAKQAEAALLRLAACLYIFLGSMFLAHYMGILGSYEGTGKETPDTYVSVHSVLGMVTVAFSVVNFVTLTCAFRPENTTLTKFLRFARVPSFVLSSVTFITGVYKFSVLEWLPEDGYCHFIAVYCVFYTFVAVKAPVLIFMKSF